jgi:hypothetical protein
MDPQHCYQASLASQDDLVAARRADLERELRSDPRCGPETEPTIPIIINVLYLLFIWRGT